jgi:hypothetical protein
LPSASINPTVAAEHSAVLVSLVLAVTAIERPNSGSQVVTGGIQFQKMELDRAAAVRQQRS